MTKEPIMIDGVDGLSCTNCSEAKRCQEQQAKKEYAINQVLQDIPSEYANVIARLKQIIPSITRCDYVLEKQLKRKEQENKELREDIKDIANLLDLDTGEEYNFGNIELEIKQLKAKEQECEELKEKCIKYGKINEQETKDYAELKAENEKMSKGYEELTEIVSPYIDDFTGYNEELKGFDIVLCVKELMQQLDQLKAALEKEKALKQTYLTCYKTKHGDVKGKLFKYEELKQALQEIKELCVQDIHTFADGTVLRYSVCDKILQKCEVIKD